MAAVGFRVSHSVRGALRASTGQAYIRRLDSPITCASAYSRDSLPFCFDRQSTAYRHAANGGVWYTRGGYCGGEQGHRVGGRDVQCRDWPAQPLRPRCGR